MESISQNYEKILENLIINNFSNIIRQNDNRNPNENKVFNYIRLLDTLDEKICEIAKNSLITVFETLDTYAHMFPNNLTDVKKAIDNLNLGS